MNPVDLPQPGLHYGVTFEDYAAWPAINFSKLKPIRKTASKCKFLMDHPKKPTPAMTIGSALHVATLEPARFDSMFVVCPPCDRRTKEGAETYANVERQAAGRLIIRSGAKEHETLFNQLAEIRGMAASIRSSRAAQLFLNAAGHNEVSMLWRDAETGLWCKARTDRLVPYFPTWSLPVVVEIKSTRDADEFNFSRDCQNMGYAGQAGCYCVGYKAVTGEMPAHVFIAVENEPPHDMKVYSLDDESLATGVRQYRQMLSRFAECAAFDQWPGYEDRLHNLSLPTWANREELAEAV